MNLDLEQNEINFLVTILNNITVKAAQPDAKTITMFVSNILLKINDIKDAPVEGTTES